MSVSILSYSTLICDQGFFKTNYQLHEHWNLCVVIGPNSAAQRVFRELFFPQVCIRLAHVDIVL